MLSPLRRPTSARVGLVLAVALLLGPAAPGTGEELDPELQRVRMAQYESEDAWVHADILVTGARVFDNRCSPCHGERGAGDGELSEVLAVRPRNYHTEAFRWGTSPSRIATTVALGRSGVMPSFKHALTEQEIWAVAYVVWRWIPEEQRTTDTPEEARRWKLP